MGKLRKKKYEMIYLILIQSIQIRPILQDFMENIISY